MSHRITAALALLAAFVFCAASARAAEEQPRSITSNGEAVVYVRPDEAVVGFGIESFAANLEKAKADNEEASVKLLKAIKAMKIEDKHIQTDIMQIEIHYKEAAHPTFGIEGYFARRSYSVTLKDVKKLEPLIDTVLKNGANQLSGFEYRSSELRKYRDQARKMAIAASREKCEALAAELGCKLGPPRTINENGYGYYGSQYSWGNNRFNVQNAMQEAGGAGGDAGAEETMPLGQIGIRANVGVAFDLIPAAAAKDAKAEVDAAVRIVELRKAYEELKQNRDQLDRDLRLDQERLKREVERDLKLDLERSKREIDRLDQERTNREVDATRVDREAIKREVDATRLDRDAVKREIERQIDATKLDREAIKRDVERENKEQPK